MNRNRSPKNLHWAYEEGRTVSTLGGKGKTKRRRLADLVLPTGRLSMGLPGGVVNEPGPVHPEVPLGRYAVYLSLAQHRPRGVGVAFALVVFGEGVPSRWEPAGGFFTDADNGCLYDESLTELLSRVSGQMDWRQWWELKEGTLGDGDGSLLLDPDTGANAIVFSTYDAYYPCFVGRDAAGAAVCLVVDCRG